MFIYGNNGAVTKPSPTATTGGRGWGVEGWGPGAEGVSRCVRDGTAAPKRAT